MTDAEFLQKYRAGGWNTLSFEELVADIHAAVLNVPFPIVSLNEDELIERIRNNYEGEVFTKIDHVTVRRDLERITEFGRLHAPKTAVFYGTLQGANLDIARITTVLETHRIFRNDIRDEKAYQIFTTSQWKVKCPMKILIIPFYVPAQHNLRLQKTSELFINRFRADFPEKFEKIMMLHSFFAEEFAKPVTNHLQYMLTAAFAEVFLKEYELDGIIYPSVKSEYRSENIALTSTAVDKIDLYKVAMYEMFINKTQCFLEPLKYATDLGAEKKDFQWIEVVDRTPRDRILKTIGLEAF